MDDDRLELLRARMEALRIKRAKLDAEEVSVVATRVAATANPCWATDLPKPFMVQLLNLLTCKPAWSYRYKRACAAIRATCSTWSSMHDAWFPGPLRLHSRGHPRSRRSVEIMEGKMKWFPSVKEVDLTWCDEALISVVLVELRSMPSLRILKLPAICAESTVDAEAVCGLTTLTTLCFEEIRQLFDEYGEPVEEQGEWVLDLSRLTSTLTTLDLTRTSVTDEAAQGLSGLTGLSTLSLDDCYSLTNEAMHAVSHLTNLTTVTIIDCFNVGTVGLCAVSRLTNLTDLHASCSHEMGAVLRAFHSLTALTSLGLCDCPQLTHEGLRTLSSLPALIKLSLFSCRNVTDEGLRALSSLTELTTLRLTRCDNVTTAGKEALRTALPNLKIEDR
jgi:hypothetical protein